MIQLADPSQAASFKGRTVIKKADGLPFEVAGGRLLKDKATGQVVDVLLKDSRGNQYQIADCWIPTLYEIVKLGNQLGIIARVLMSQGEINSILAYDISSYKGYYFSSKNPANLKLLAFYRGEILDKERQQAFVGFLSQCQTNLSEVKRSWRSTCKQCQQNAFIESWNVCENGCGAIAASSRQEEWTLETRVRYLQENLDRLSRSQLNFANILLEEYKKKGRLSVKQVEVLDKFVNNIRGL